MFIDTHCHLDFAVFARDLLEVFNAAYKNDVGLFLVPAIDLSSSGETLAFCQKNSNVYAAIGVHPNDIENLTPRQIMEGLKRLSGDKNLVAIGEIGLDYHHNSTERNLQIDVFCTQVEFAIEHDLPVIVHSREAMDDVQKILGSYYKKIATEFPSAYGVLHSFEGDIKAAQNAISLGFMIGIGGPVTYKNAQIKQSVTKAIPLESILLETDCPFLSPEPLRGRRNEPANIKIIAEKIAFLKECDIKQVEKQTTMNAMSLFNFGAEIDSY